MLSEMNSLADDHEEFVKSLAPRAEVVCNRIKGSFQPHTVRARRSDNLSMPHRTIWIDLSHSVFLVKTVGIIEQHFLADHNGIKVHLVKNAKRLSQCNSKSGPYSFLYLKMIQNPGFVAPIFNSEQVGTCGNPRE